MFHYGHIEIPIGKHLSLWASPPAPTAQQILPQNGRGLPSLMVWLGALGRLVVWIPKGFPKMKGIGILSIGASRMNPRWENKKKLGLNSIYKRYRQWTTETVEIKVQKIPFGLIILDLYDCWN